MTMYIVSQLLLLVSLGCLAAGFQPDDFHYWYLQSSVVVDDRLYVVAGDIVTASQKIQFMSYTYSIDLSRSWTTSDVEAQAVSTARLITHVKQPMLWYNPQENQVHMWGGLTFNGSELPGSYSFSPSGSGGVVWQESPAPSSNEGTIGTLRGLWGSAYTTSPTTLYSLGGVDTVDGVITPVTSTVTDEFDTNTWTNDTSTSGFGSELNFDSRVEYVPNFGDGGVLLALGGRVFQNQSSYTLGDYTLAGFSSVNVYDTDSKTWYSQQTTGDVPPQVSDFCTVGVESGDGGSYELYMFGGATNHTYDTTNSNDPAYRDIYILSLPAFTWVRAGRTSELRRRAMHCQLIGNSQMLVIGGSFFANDDLSRVDPWPNGMAVFDLSTFDWTENYNHLAEKYSRPSPVQDVYRQSTEPTWDDPALAALFPFRQSLTTTATSGNTTATQPSPSPSSSPTSDVPKSKSSNTGAIAGGVVGGVAAIALVVTGAWLILRKRARSSETKQDSLTSESALEMYEKANTIPEMHGQAKAVSEMHGEAKPPLYEKDAVPRRYEMAGPGNASELPGDTPMPKRL